MSSATNNFLCPCGAVHPLGFVCDAPRRGERPDSIRLAGEELCSPTCQCEEASARFENALTKHAADGGACSKERQDEPIPSGGGSHNHKEHALPSRELACRCEKNAAQGAAPASGHDATPCCGTTHTAPEQADLSSFGDASNTRAIYRIPNMDCPMEENLIRKKLGDMPGIVGLRFNLMQRVLTVDHALPSTQPIEEALKAIDMTPEPLGASQQSMSRFLVADMDCPAEESLIRSRLAGMPGVLGLEFNLMQRVLSVTHLPSALPEISEALQSLNMGARLIDLESDEARAIPETKIPWKKLALAGFLAAVSEGLHLIHEWNLSPFGLDIAAWKINGTEVFAWLPLLFAVLAILLAGLGTYKKGWLAVRNGNLNINALMSVAVTGAVIIGQYPEAAMVMLLFNLSEAIEAKALDRARKAIKNLLALAPEKAVVRLPDGAWEEMDIRQVEVGRRVRVRPGERVALDGVVVLGQSAVNQAPITGESMPVEKTAGDAVYAGSINESGSFEFEVSARADNSTLARIIHAVEEAQGTRAPTQRFVDQFAKYYTPAVFLAAILTALIPPLFMNSGFHESIYTALVLLVIGCPCALVISTPISIVSGMAAATRQGVLVKGGVFLEQGRLLDWLALDKTGTITRGKPSQTDFVNLGTMEDSQVASLAASLAARSDHPISRAIAEKAAETGLRLFEADGFAAVPGQGVSGLIEGRQWRLGNHRMIEESGKCSPVIEERIFALERQGKSVVALIGDKVEGLFAAADTIKEGSVEAIRELKKLGVKTMMLTGDNEHTAKAVAAQAGVDEFRAGLLPEDKLRIVEELQKSGARTGMAGDGINDAPALAKADIGFAMAGAGTDSAIETADVALMDDDLRKLPRFIRLSRSTHAILAQNIALAVGVKALFFALTFMGMATMWMAVFADVGTALIVVANGLRAMTK